MMRRLIFNFHKYAALITLPFLLMYAISGFFFAHSFLGLSRYTSTNNMLDPNTKIESEAEGVNYLVERYAISPAEYDIYSTTDNERFVNLSLEGVNSSFTLKRDENEQWNMVRRTPNFAAYLQSLHRLAGINQQSRSFRYWGYIALVVALSLIVVSVSGIVLWLKRIQNRKAYSLILMTSAAYCIIVLSVLRWAG